MRRRRFLAGASAIGVLALRGLPGARAEVRVPAGVRIEEVVVDLPRPVELAFDAIGRLVVLSHGWRGDAAAEIYRLDLAGPVPIDAGRAPKLVVPFAASPRKAAFGSLVVDPRSGDLFLGEENGNRIARLTAEAALETFAVGLHHLVGGSSLAFDPQGRLVVLDFASAQGRLRSEAPPLPELDWLTGEAYDGPLVFRLASPGEVPGPRRLDLIPPLFPRLGRQGHAGSVLPRFISVAASPAGALWLLGDLGQLFRLTPEGELRLLARLPAGHYHRTHLAMGPDGSVFVGSGFHLRQVFRVARDGEVVRVAWDLGDPGGIVVDAAGILYVAETARHRIIRMVP